ncbi:hypothetical protein KKB18_00615, partial [bacterium]|nr:hypothetical protein [bacterium]
MKHKYAIFYLCFFIISLSTFYLSCFKIANHDLWFHIKTGEIIVDNFTSNKDFFIPRQEIFSHTMKGAPWIAHEWLFAVISFLIYSFSGATGLILFKSILITSAYILLFRIIFVMTDDPAISLLFTIIPVCLSRFRFFERPDCYSSLFLAITLYAVLDIKKGKKFTLLILPIVTIIWVNIHGAMGILCPAILSLYYISQFVDEFMKKPRSLKKIGDLLNGTKILGGIILLCFFCLLINPSMTGVFSEGKDILFSHNIRNVVQVPEWMPPGTEFIGFWVYLVISCIILGITFRYIDLYSFMLFIVFAFGAISARRNIPLFAMTSAPILAFHLELFLKKLSTTNGTEKDRDMSFRGNSIYQASLIVLSLIILTIALWNTPPYIQFGTGIKGGAFPEDAVKFFKEKKITGKMYNTHWYGGYLAFRLYPDYEIFIDGRNTIFTLLWQKFRVESWDKVLDEYKVNFAILDYRRDSLYKFFRMSPLWHLIYFDDNS